MLKRIKEYFKYRAYRKIVKRELIRMAAALLPAVSDFAEKKADALQFIQKVIDSGKNLEGEQLIRMILDQAADKLATDQARLIRILQYMAGLSPEDMRRILVHSMVETMEADQGNEDQNNE